MFYVSYPHAWLKKYPLIGWAITTSFKENNFWKDNTKCSRRDFQEPQRKSNCWASRATTCHFAWSRHHREKAWGHASKEYRSSQGNNGFCLGYVYFTIGHSSFTFLSINCHSYCLWYLRRNAKSPKYGRKVLKIGLFFWYQESIDIFYIFSLMQGCIKQEIFLKFSLFFFPKMETVF